MIWSHNVLRSHLQPEVQLLERAADLSHQHVHTLALLEADQDVGRPLGRLGGDVGHVVHLGELLQHLVQNSFYLRRSE